MRDFAQVFGDKPDRIFCDHPVKMIEPGEIHRTRISPKGAFSAQIKIDIEIAHGQLAQAAIDGLAITAAGEIRLRHGAPVRAYLENGDNMIGVLFGFQIEDQCWESDDAKRRRGKNSALET